MLPDAQTLVVRPWDPLSFVTSRPSEAAADRGANRRSGCSAPWGTQTRPALDARPFHSRRHVPNEFSHMVEEYARPHERVQMACAGNHHGLAARKVFLKAMQRLQAPRVLAENCESGAVERLQPVRGQPRHCAHLLDGRCRANELEPALRHAGIAVPLYEQRALDPSVEPTEGRLALQAKPLLVRAVRHLWNGVRPVVKIRDVHCRLAPGRRIPFKWVRLETWEPYVSECQRWNTIGM